EDVPLLAYHFLHKYASRSGSAVKKISPEAMRLLSAQRWPGNVRELENAIEHAVVFCKDDTLTPAELPFSKTTNGSSHSASLGGGGGAQGLIDLAYREAKERALQTFEEAYFAALLQRTAGNVSEAARQAGLDRSNFRRAVKRAGVKI